MASVTQAILAEEIGIPRDRLSNYEKGRAPLRCEVALRICRQLIISEEWFATGSTRALDLIARQRFGGKGSLTKLRKEVFVRQCFDLLSEPITRSIAPGTLFSSAYDEILRTTYQTLAEQFFNFPRITFTDEVREPTLAARLIDVIFDRQLRLVRQLAEDVNRIDAWPMQRQFTRAIFRLSMKAFREFGTPALDAGRLQRFVEAVESLEAHAGASVGSK